MKWLYDFQQHKNLPVLYVIGLSLLLMTATDLHAQVTIRGSASYSNYGCSDCCDGDCTDGNYGDFCSDLEWDNKDVERYCGTTTVRVYADVWDADGIWPDECLIWDCNAQGSRSCNISVSSPTCSGSYSVSNGCWATQNYSVWVEGSWACNADAGGIKNDNGRCSAMVPGDCGVGGDNACCNAWVQSSHTMDCGDNAWYRYRLTNANIQWLSFTGDKKGGGLTSYTTIDEVWYSTSASGCSSACQLSDDGNNGDFAIESPQVGYYWVQIEERLGNITKFEIDVAKGPSKIAYDDICNARSRGIVPNSNVGGAQEYWTGSNSGATSQDFCGVGEPNDDDNRTIWHWFYTGSDIGHAMRIYVNGNGGNEMTPDIAVYRYGNPGDGYTTNQFSCSSTPNFGLLTLLEDDDGTTDPVTCSLSDQDAEVWLHTCTGDLTPNTLYYLQVDGDDGSLYCTLAEGDFSVRIDHKEAPDLTCNAFDVGTYAGGGTLSLGEHIDYDYFTNRCAGRTSGEPNSSSGDRTIWLKFKTAGSSSIGDKITIDADGYGMDPCGVPFQPGGAKVYVYTSGATSGNCEPDSLVTQTSTGFFDESVAEINCPKPDTWYYIQIQARELIGLICEEQYFTLDIDMSSNTNFSRPSNDDICATATRLGGTNIITCEVTPWTSGNNACASLELNEAGFPGSGIDNGDQTVWYYFETGSQPPVEITVDANGGFTNGNCEFWFGLADGSFYPFINVYKAPSLACPSGINNLTLTENTDGIFGLDPDPTDWTIDCPEPNSRYYIQLYTGWTSICDDGSFTIRVSGNCMERSEGDDVCNAIDLQTLTNGEYINASTQYNGGTNFTTFCSSKQAGEPNVDLSELATDEEGSIWFKFQVAGNIGDAPTIGAMTEIWTTGEGEYSALEQMYVRLYTGNCSNPSGLMELSNVEDEAYYYNDVLCIGQLLVDETPRTRIYGCLEPGVTYYVQVVVKESALGVPFDTDPLGPDERAHFNLYIQNSRPIPADNDDFVDATPIPALANATLPPNNAYPAASLLDNENNLCATVEAWEDPDDAVFDTYEHTVWYSFVAPASGSVQFQLQSDGNTSPEADIEEEFIVYDIVDTDMNPLTDPDTIPLYSFSAEISAFDPFNIFEDGEVTWDDYAFVTCLTPGRTYYVAVDGDYDGLTGYCPGDAMRGVFDLEIRDYDIWAPSAQGNGNLYLDFICGAKDLMAGQNMSAWMACNSNHSFTVTQQDNYCADNENESFSSPWDDDIEQTVWYTFVAPASGKVEIKLENELDCSFITALLDTDLKPFIDLRGAVYEFVGDCSDVNANGLDDSDLILHGSVENFIPFLDLGFTCVTLDKSFEVECLVPGNTYYLLVDGRAGGFSQENDYKYGEFQITMTADPRDAPAPNDLLCDAIDLGDIETGPKVANGGTCQNSENNFCATATGDAGPPDPAPIGFTVDQGVWYTFTAPSSGQVDIFVDNNPSSQPQSDLMQTQIVVFENIGSSCNTNPDSLIAIDWTTILNGVFDASLTVSCLDPGQEYHILVDGGYLTPLDEFLVEGYFNVTVSENNDPPPPSPGNDDVCDAYDIETTTGQSLWVGDNPSGLLLEIDDQFNTCATLELINGGDPSTFSRDRTVWYKFQTPNGTGPYAVDIDITSGLPWPFGDAMDPQFAVYELPGSCAPANVEEFFSNYGPLGVPFYEEDEVHCLEPNTWYYIMVDGSLLNRQGNFNLDIEAITPKPVAPNDLICDAGPGAAGDLGVLGEDDGDQIGSHAPGNEHNNFCASVEPGEPDPAGFGLDRTVWFSFVTPNVADNINVDIYLESDPNGLGDGIDLQVGLYESDDETCTGNLWEIESDYDPIFWDEDLVDLCLKPNTRYFLQVDGANPNIFPWTDEYQGYFTLVIENDGLQAGPPNDDFCNATLLTLGVNSGTQDNFCATTEINEPLAGSEIQASVWYKFVAPPSGRVNINLDKEGLFTWFIPEWNLWDETTFNEGGFPNPSGDPCSGGAIKGTTNFVELANTDFAPTWSVDYECLFPGRTYYIQVDGIRNFADFLNNLEGEFNITVTDLIPSYGTGAGGDPEPVHNDCSNPLPLSVQSESCQWEGGTWDQPRNYGTATRSYYTVPSGCGSDCGDTWYSFTMPNVFPGCEDPGLSFVKIEGLDDSGLFGLFDTDLQVNAYRGTCGELTLVKINCDNGGVGDDVDYSIAGTPGETIFLQVFSNDGNTDDNKDFAICVSQRKSADNCLDAVAAGDMELNVEYCWDTRDATPDDLPNNGYQMDNEDPEKSTYFKFTTDADYCWGYQLILRTPDLDEYENCQDGSGFDHLQLAVYYDTDGTLCDDMETGRLDYEDFNDCDPRYLNDVVWSKIYYVDNYPPLDGDSIPLGTDLIVQLEGSDAVMDGTIMLRQLCDGREWEHVSALGTTSSDGYCEDAEGWRHYYDDAGTPLDASDDILIFSIHPLLNTNFDGVASITLLDNYTHAYQFDAPGGWGWWYNLAHRWTMRRFWNFELAPGSDMDDGPVAVRFYYRESEKDEIIQAAIDWKAFHESWTPPVTGLAIQPFEWFKTDDGVAFDPSFVKPNFIEFTRNGMSESGQFTSRQFSVAADNPSATSSFTWPVEVDYRGPGQDLDDDTRNMWCNDVEYVELYGINSFSGGTGTVGLTFFSSSPLPVELVSFVGWNDGSVNRLEWVTASEINNDVFVVERSADGIDFIEIGEVDGHGTTSEEHTYNLTDFTPIQGVNYYRLKIIDFDGSFEYSSIIAIEMNASDIRTAIVRLHPNPTLDFINIQLQAAHRTTFDMMILDVTGRVVHMQTVEADAGLNAPFLLDVNEYKSGMYIINMTDVNTGDKLEAKFIKQ